MRVEPTAKNRLAQCPRVAVAVPLGKISLNISLFLPPLPHSSEDTRSSLGAFGFPGLRLALVRDTVLRFAFTRTNPVEVPISEI